MILNPAHFAALVAEANMAPNVHNTQPTRWRLADDGSVLVLEDAARRLPVGDPAGRDADVSHGAAIEGFVLAAGVREWSVAVEAAPALNDPAFRPIARLVLAEGGGDDPLRAFIGHRRAYRGAFVRGAAPGILDPLAQADDVRLVRDPDGIRRLARLNDEASLKTFRDAAFRAELLSWMRLKRSDPNWARDGLNAEAMEMSGFEALAAGTVLSRGVFETLDKVGLSPLLVAEAAVVRSALGIVLFHRPEGEPPLETGRRFHRLWLSFTALGLCATPMAVLADDADARAAVAQAFDIPAGRRLITAFRVGVAPDRKLSPKPRLPLAELIV